MNDEDGGVLNDDGRIMISDYKHRFCVTYIDILNVA